MEKVIVTGATSFIASNLIEELIKRKYKVYAILRKNSANKEKILKFKGVNIIELDLKDLDKLPLYIHEKCDVMFHFAWDGTRGDDRENSKIQKQNVTNSLKAVISANKLGCKKFFMAGSQAEYGMQNIAVSEDMKCFPISEYGKAKFEFYKQADAFCQNQKMNLYEIRIFSIYGPKDYSKSLVMSTLQKFLNNEKIVLSSCLQNWNFLYIKDLINALIMINELNVPSGVYNLAGKKTKKLKEYILEMKKITNSSSEIIFGRDTPPGINPDISKIEKGTNWKEKYTFKDGIIEIINSMKEDGV